MSSSVKLLILARSIRRNARFWAKVDMRGPVPEHQPELGPCWVWTAGTCKLGYGRFQLGRGKRGGVILAHRMSYMLLVGDIPVGKELDHLCRNHGCVNPVHLESVTHHENLLRGNTVTARNAAKTHCAQGHPFVGDNLMYDSAGRRMCRTCRRAWNRAYWQRRRQRS